MKNLVWLLYSEALNFPYIVVGRRALHILQPAESPFPVSLFSITSTLPHIYLYHFHPTNSAKYQRGSRLNVVE